MTSSDFQPGTDDAIDSIIAEYCRQVDTGAAPDRKAFLAKYPEAAAALESYFATVDVVERMAGAPISDLNAPVTENETLQLPSADIAAPPADPARDSTLRNRQATVIKERSSLTGLETLPPVEKETIDRGAPRTPASAGAPQQIGRYRIEKVLGQGAMGTVYLAYDTGLERRVALKIPKFSATDGHEFVERFYREARTAANLRNPNICPVYDVGEIDGNPFITMAFIEGKTLSEYIRPEALQSERQIAFVVRKLANALAEAHAHGIVHRDLKPANIMIDSKGEPIIMDFGLAREMSGDPDSTRLTHLGMMIGTPAYMPPEQVNGENDRVGERSDIYALGVILYELLTGKIPFQGPLAAVLGQILTVEPAPPSKHRPGLDPRLEAVCLKMMAKRIEDRPESMTEVASMITEILKTPRPAAPQAPTEPARDAAPSPKDRLRNTPKVELDAIGRTARRLFAKHDYEQTVQLLEQIPADARSSRLSELLQEAIDRNDEVNFLIARLQDGLGRNHLADLEPIVERLLILKPGNRLGIEARERIEQAAARRRRSLWKLIGFGSLPPVARTAAGFLFFAFVCAAVVIIVRQRDEKTGTETVTEVEVPEDPSKAIRVRVNQSVAAVGGDASGIRPRRGQTDIRIGADGSKRSREQQLKPRGVVPSGKGPSKAEMAVAPQGSAAPGTGVSGTGDLRWILKGHTKAVRDIAISPDSRWIVSCGHDETVRIWDAQTGKETHKIEGMYTSAVFTPDGRSLILGSITWFGPWLNSLYSVQRPTVRLRKFFVEFLTPCLAMSADGTRLASSQPVGVHIWDAKSRVLVQRLEKAPQATFRLAFDPEGKYLFGSVGKEQVARWDLATGKLKLFSRTGSDYAVLSPDGRTVAVTNWSGGHDLLNFETGELITHVHSPHAKGSPRSVAFSPNGKYLLSGADDQQVNLVEISKQITLKRFTGHEDVVHHALFSPDGTFAVSACDLVYDLKLKDVRDTRDTSIRVWSLPPEVSGRAGGAAVATATPSQSAVPAAAKWTPKSFGPPVTPEQPRGELARANFRWKIGGDANTFGPRATWVVFSPDSRYLATTEGTHPPKVIDTKAGKIIRELPESAHGAFAFAPDGKSAVLLPRSARRLLFFDIETGTVSQSKIEVGEEYSDIGFLRDGSLILFAGNAGGRFAIFDMPGGQRTIDRDIGSQGWGHRQAYTADGALVASGTGPRAGVAVWDRNQNKTVVDYRAHPQPHWLSALAFSHDGEYLASASHDRTVKFWKPGTSEMLFELSHTDWLEAVSFSADDRYLAVSTHTKGYSIWDVAKRKIVATIPPVDLTGTGVAISPDGKMVAVSSARHNSKNHPPPRNPDGFAEVQLWELQYEAPAP